MTIPLKNLRQGEFKSILRLVQAVPDKPDETHVEVEIPMVIKVHHDWHVPLAVLIGGVALGMFFSWFKVSGKDRDIALTGRDGLVSIASDPGQPRLLTEVLRVSHGGHRRDHLEFRLGRLAGRRQTGRGLVLRWRRDSADWEALSNYLLTFRSELQHYPQESRTMRTIKEQAPRKTSELALAESSEPLRNQLNVWRDQLELYSKTQQLLANLTHLRTQAPAEAANEFSIKENEFDDRLREACARQQTRFRDSPSRPQRRELQAPGGHPTAGSPPRWCRQRGCRASRCAQVPANLRRSRPHPCGWTDKIPTLNYLAFGRWLRLKFMGWLGYVFPASVFVFTGLSQLYMANPTFGLLTDYVALFLWGFGSDAGGSKLQMT